MQRVSQRIQDVTPRRPIPALMFQVFERFDEMLARRIDDQPDPLVGIEEKRQHDVVTIDDVGVGLWVIAGKSLCGEVENVRSSRVTQRFTGGIGITEEASAPPLWSLGLEALPGQPGRDHLGVLVGGRR